MTNLLCLWSRKIVPCWIVLIFLAGTAHADELKLTADSFVLDAGKIDLEVWPYTRQIADIVARARLVNHSSVQVGAAIKGESTSIGECTGQERSAGLDVIWPDDLKKLQKEAEAGKDVSKSLSLLPANGSVKFTITLNCSGDVDQYPGQTSLSLSVIIATDKQVLVVPVSTSDLSIHLPE